MNPYQAAEAILDAAKELREANSKLDLNHRQIEREVEARAKIVEALRVCTATLAGFSDAMFDEHPQLLGTQTEHNIYNALAKAREALR